MDKTDVERLGALARIELTESEIDSYSNDITGILSYVAQVQGMSDGDEENEPEVGDRYNIFRKDMVTNEPDSFTEALLESMPKRRGRFLEVKKILNTDSE